MGRRNANSHQRRGNAKIASGGKGHGEGGVTEADVQRHAAGRSLHYVPPLTSLCPATTALVANIQDAEATANQYNQRQSAVHRCVRCPLRPLTGSVWIHLTGSIWIVGWLCLDSPAWLYLDFGLVPPLCLLLLPQCQRHSQY